MMIISLAVPGTFAPNVGLVDVETAKVPAPPQYVLPSGEPLRKRWSVVAAGLASDGLVELVAEPTEAETLRELGWRAAGLSELRYGATREFDEMILRGRFTNARRAHLPEPAWPAMPGAESAKWVNVGTAKSGVERLPDLPSREVPAAWSRGDRLVVLVHLLRDVADLILVAGEPDDEAAEWCERVLGEPGFAEGLLAAA